MRIDTERLTFAAFVAALALLGVTATAAYLAYEAELRERHLAQEASAALQSVSGLRAAVLATESAGRGFAPTGDLAFLSRLDEAVAQARSELDQLRRAPGDAEEDALVAELEELVDERIARSREVIAARRDEGAEAAVALIATRQGLLVTDRIVEACSRLDARLGARLEAAQAHAARHALASSLTALGAFVIGILLASLTVLLLRARLKAAAEAQEVAEGLVQLVGASDEAIIGKSLDGIVLSWNSGAERLYGYTEGEMVGRPIGVIVPEDRRAEIGAAVARVHAGATVAPFDTVRLRKDGSRVPVSVSLAPVRGADGTVVGVATVARDATAALRAASDREALIVELRRAAQRQRTLEGLLPTCAWCKAIRDETGTWLPMESYLGQRAPLQFTHGICTACTERLRQEGRRA